MSDHSDTVSAPFIGGLLAAARALGLDTPRIAEVAGFDATVQGDPDLRVPRRTFLTVWKEIITQSPVPHIGLQLAEKTALDRFDVLGYAMRHAATLGDAYRQMARYSHLLHNGVDITMEVVGDEVRLGYQQPADAPRPVAEWVLASAVVTGRSLVGDDWVPRRVTFEDTAPASTEPYERLFGSPVRFGAVKNTLAIDLGILGRPVVHSDPRLSALVGRYAEDLMTRIRTSESLIDRARHIIAGELASGDARLEAVAEKLEMSPRTLQRRLKDEGVASYRDLLDDVRRELAIQYLRDPALAIRETAFLLGFSEPSAFHRAFKRWTGKTPGEFRG